MCRACLSVIQDGRICSLFVVLEVDSDCILIQGDALTWYTVKILKL